MLWHRRVRKLLRNGRNPRHQGISAGEHQMGRTRGPKSSLWRRRALISITTFKEFLTMEAFRPTPLRRSL
jgi:hypothetical protein